jgi:hypothetical protein
MSTLAERQAEWCGYFMPAFPMRSAAVIGGNATQESLCQPVTVGAKDHGSDGTLQWRLERLDGPDGLKAWCAASGLAWDTLKGQALFTMHELLQPQYTALLADLRAGTKSLETLTLNFCDAFERPSAAGREADKRIAYSHACLSIMMRDLPPVLHPAPGVPTMPTSIEMAVLEQLAKAFAPMIESAVAGLIKGWITHVPGASVTPSGMITIDPAALEKMIEAAIAKLQAGKTA